MFSINVGQNIMHRQRLYFSRDHVLWYCSSVPSSWHPFIIILYDRSLFDDDSLFLNISSACGYCSDILSFRLVRLSVHRASTRIHSCAFPPLIAPFRYTDKRSDERRLHIYPQWLDTSPRKRHMIRWALVEFSPYIGASPFEPLMYRHPSCKCLLSLSALPRQFCSLNLVLKALSAGTEHWSFRQRPRSFQIAA